MTVLRSMRVGVGVLDVDTDRRIRRRVLDGLRTTEASDPRFSHARVLEVIDLVAPRGAEPIARALVQTPRRAGSVTDPPLLAVLSTAGRSSANLRIRLLAAAAVLVVLAGLVTAVGRGRVDDPGVQTGSGDPRLGQLAATIRSQPATPLLGTGLYQHTVAITGTRTTLPGAADGIFRRQTVEKWQKADGSGLEVDRETRERPFSKPAGTFVANEQLNTRPSAPLNGALFADLTYDELIDLPTTSPALLERLRAAPRLGLATINRADRAKAMLRLVDQPGTRPEVRAALITLLGEEGMRAVGEVTDSQGRTGQGFEVSDVDAGKIVTAIFAPDSGVLLSWQITETATSLPIESVVSLSVEAVTDTAG